MKKALRLCPILIAIPAMLTAQYPGDLIITEFMAHSEEVPDDQGEYIELYNNTFYEVNLNGCVIQDGSALYVAPAEDVWIEPGEFAAVGRAAVPYARYYFPASPPPFNLNNIGGDQITVTCGGALVAGLTYTANQAAGVSMELAATNLHVGGITQEADYAPSTYPFRYLGVTTTDYGSPGYAGNTFVLPVTLRYFEASLEGRQTRLRWATETEQNNSHFVVEHSLDARQFGPIGEVPGAGTTTSPHEYAFTHTNPHPGLNYYRLRQVDYDGTATLFPLRAIEMPAWGQPMRIFPTVTGNILNLEFSTPATEPTVLSAYNLQGRQVVRRPIPPNTRTLQLDITTLPPGPYFLQWQPRAPPPPPTPFIKQ